MISKGVKRLVVWSRPPTIVWIIVAAISVAIIAERLISDRDLDKNLCAKQEAAHNKTAPLQAKGK